MLNTLIIKTYVPAKPAVTIDANSEPAGADPKISDIIVLATPNTPIPAETLKQSTIHN